MDNYVNGFIKKRVLFVSVKFSTDILSDLTKREKRSVHMDKPVYTDHMHRRFTLIDFGGVNFELSDVEVNIFVFLM